MGRTRNRECYTFLLFVIFSLLPYVTPKVKIQWSTDGPAIMGSDITFTLKLLNPEEESYDVIWNELTRVGRVSGDVLNKKNQYTTNWTLHYLPEAPPGKQVGPDVPFAYPGSYTVTATVSYLILGFFVKNVGTVLCGYELKRDFPLTLEPQQPGVIVNKTNPDIVTVLNETKLVANVHDAHNYLGQALNLTYTWFNATSFIANTSDPFLKQNLTKEGAYYYNVTLTGLYNSTLNPNTTVVRTGSDEVKVLAKAPINNFTVGGEKWFRQGKLLDLRISCSGSQPFTYCIMLHTGPYNLTGNETCINPEVTTTCELGYMRYFNAPGFHSMVIIMQNDVSRIVNYTLINVYNVSKQQPLSIIIVPIACTLIALVMIIFGVAYFWENRARYTVEVADFDFGQREELPYMTFVERLKDAFTASTSSRVRLYNSTDDERPIFGSRRPSS